MQLSYDCRMILTPLRAIEGSMMTDDRGYLSRFDMSWRLGKAYTWVRRISNRNHITFQDHRRFHLSIFTNRLPSMEEEYAFNMEKVSPIWIITALCVVPFGMYQLLNLLSPLMQRLTAMKISAVCWMIIRCLRSCADDSTARYTSTPSSRYGPSRSPKPLPPLMVSSTTVRFPRPFYTGTMLTSPRLLHATPKNRRWL